MALNIRLNNFFLKKSLQTKSLKKLSWLYSKELSNKFKKLGKSLRLYKVFGNK